MAVHEHLNGTMNRFYVDWVIDSRTPPYIRTILGHFHVYWSNWVRLHQMVSRVIHAIHVPRNLLRYALDNFRTKYKSVFLGPVCWFRNRNRFEFNVNVYGTTQTNSVDIGDCMCEHIKKNNNKKIEKLVTIY